MYDNRACFEWTFLLVMCQLFETICYISPIHVKIIIIIMTDKKLVFASAGLRFANSVIFVFYWQLSNEKVWD